MFASVADVLSDEERSAVETRFKFLLRDNAKRNDVYVGLQHLALESLDDDEFARLCTEVLSSTFWATWSLDDAEPCLLVQLTRSSDKHVEMFLVEPSRRMHALRRDGNGVLPFEFRRFNSSAGEHTHPTLVLQGELVRSRESERVSFAATECLWNGRSYLGNTDRQSRMNVARACIDAEPFKRPLLTRGTLDPAHDPSTVLANVLYKPHVTSLQAEAVVKDVPRAFREFTVDGIELRSSIATHTLAAEGPSAYTLALSSSASRIRRLLDALGTSQKDEMVTKDDT